MTCEALPVNGQVIRVGDLRKKGAGAVWEVRRIERQFTCRTGEAAGHNGPWLVWLWRVDGEGYGHGFSPEDVARRFKLIERKP